MKLSVLVKPRAKKSVVVSFVDDVLAVRVAAFPYKGASNKELLRTLSSFFSISPSQISIVSGFKSKVKILEFNCKDEILNLALKKLL